MMTGDEPAAGGVAEAEALRPRHARRPHHGADDDVETAMCRCLRECAAQIARNLEVVALTDSPGGPHQLRVGLRRLRVALWLFRDEAGAEGAMLREEARAMARLVGPLRDRDVLADEILPRGLAGFADQPARAALAALLEADRAQARARIRAALAEPPMAGLPRRLELFIADRGWRAECDGPRAAALARPLAGRVPGLLDRCLRRVHARGRDPARLSVEQRHELRKAVKTLRYAIEFLTPAGKGRARDYLRAVKALQDRFGALNDAATAAALLAPGAMAGLDAPGPARAAGFLLGVLWERERREIAGFAKHWDRFRRTRPFWRR